MSATGQCPGCGNELVFRVATSTIAVCSFCRTIVARGGATLEAIGTTNEVLVTGSALQLGLQASHGGRPFTVVGRTQLRHDLGGAWDEWLVSFDDGGRLAWLAEHQGRLALYGKANVNEAPRLSSPEKATPGQAMLSGLGELIVVERGTATVVAEQGELPERTLPGARRPFVDFTSRDGRCATLDFGAVNVDGTRQPKRFFVGRELTLADLGLQRAPVEPPSLPRAEGATALRCPHCGAPVERKRTDTESLTCGYCNSALSIDNGALALLFRQEKLAWQPLIKPGTTARLDEGFFRAARALGPQPRPWPTSLDVEVVAHVVRSVVVDGVRYTFQEHLLQTARDGFFWLIESDGEWLFARPLDAGLVTKKGIAVQLEGRTFHHQQTNTARVEQVIGELYWRVSKLDLAKMSDYRSAPRTLSREETANEVLWTECLDVPRGEVARVFGVRPPAPPPVASHDEEGGLASAPFGRGATAERLKNAFLYLIVIAWVLISVCDVIFDDDDDDDDGSGGGHGSYGGGGGFSFGK